MMLMTTVNALAQKEYNMVITLNNGTTVTLGHNDIKEITFNDGEISISGNMVNTIDSLAGVTVEQGYRIENLEYDNKYIASYLEDETAKTRERLDQHEMMMNGLHNNVIDYLNAESNELRGDITNLHEIITLLNAESDKLRGHIDNLYNNNNLLLNMVYDILKTIEELHPESADNPDINKVKAALASAREAADSARKTAVKQDKK